MNDDGAIGSAWPGQAWLWLSAWLGSVAVGRRRRSLDSDLGISTHRSEISGRVARPVFFEGSSAPGARTDGRTHKMFWLCQICEFEKTHLTAAASCQACRTSKKCRITKVGLRKAIILECRGWPVIPWRRRNDGTTNLITSDCKRRRLRTGGGFALSLPVHSTPFPEV